MFSFCAVLIESLVAIGFELIMNWLYDHKMGCYMQILIFNMVKWLRYANQIMKLTSQSYGLPIQ